jgi:hypothetical protein
VTNVIGLRRRTPAGDGSAGDGELVGPLHAVDGVAGRAAAENATDVHALCGEWVQVVALEEVPDDAGLCPGCQYGA